MNKKYMLFVYSNYYPCGGCNDFAGFYSNLEDARGDFETFCKDGLYWCAHVFNTETHKVEAAWEYTLQNDGNLKFKHVVVDDKFDPDQTDAKGLYDRFAEIRAKREKEDDWPRNLF